jgi:formylglycine-generating enzyme required for sulfatase activity
MSVPDASLDLLLQRIGTTAGAAPAPGALGRFHVRRLLGSGRFAMVAEADDPKLGRRVALKLPLPEVLADAKLRERLVREAQLAARLDHPGIVPVHEAVEAGPDVMFLVLGLVEGPTLDRWLALRAPVPVDTACRLMAAVADAVQHAHDRHILHLDLKPSNILLDGRNELLPGVGTPRVADFGRARATAGSMPKTSVLTAGTPGFMAPEQLRGPRSELTERTDVWALGVLLYQMLMGELPFGGKDFASALTALRAAPIPPSARRPDLPRALDGVVRACLQFNPTDRYPSAAALGADLRAIAAGRPPVHLPGSGRTHRRRMVAAFLAGAMAASVALVAVHEVQHQRDDPPKSGERVPTPPDKLAAAATLTYPEGKHFTNRLGMKLVRIEPGEYVMGSPPTDSMRQEGEDQRVVRIRQPFYLGQFEVTYEQFEAFVKDAHHITDAEKISPNGHPFGGCGWSPRNHNVRFSSEFNWRNSGYRQSPDHPVGNVSWDDAAAFCNWLTGYDGYRYDLPTEEEWEYACRAGSKTRFPFGDDPKDIFQYARVTRESPAGLLGFFDRLREDVLPGPDPVGSHRPNDWGLYDMMGNQWEWCLDGYAGWEDCRRARSPIRHQSLGSPLIRVCRGGSWDSGVNGLRSAHRLPAEQKKAWVASGFRVWCRAVPDE